MHKELLEEARSMMEVDFLPTGPRILVYPVVVDEKRMIEVVEFQKRLPDMGLILAVGWEANARALDSLSGLDEQSKELALRAAMWTPGEVVCLNKFSGMAVPGTELMCIRVEDVFGKVTGLPFRLRKPKDREGDERGPMLHRVQAVPGRL